MQPQQPLWHLKVGQIAADYSVTLLFSLILAILALQFRPGQSHIGESVASVRRFRSIVIAVYLLLIPIQFLGFGLHGIQSSQRDNEVIRRAQMQVAIMRRRILGASKLAQLLEDIGGEIALSVPKGKSSQLTTEQKNTLIDTIDADLTRLRLNLKNQRQQQMTALVLKTSKAIMSSALIPFGVSRVKSLQPTR